MWFFFVCADSGQFELWFWGNENYGASTSLLVKYSCGIFLIYLDFVCCGFGAPFFIYVGIKVCICIVYSWYWRVSRWSGLISPALPQPFPRICVRWGGPKDKLLLRESTLQPWGGKPPEASRLTAATTPPGVTPFNISCQENCNRSDTGLVLIQMETNLNSFTRALTRNRRGMPQRGLVLSGADTNFNYHILWFDLYLMLRGKHRKTVICIRFVIGGLARRFSKCWNSWWNINLNMLCCSSFRLHDNFNTWLSFLSYENNRFRR